MANSLIVRGGALAVLFGLLVANLEAALVSDYLEKKYELAEPFAVTDSDYAPYELVLGPIDYVLPTAPGEVEGFAPESRALFEGRVRRSVYDLSAGVSPLGARNSIEQLLLSQRYRVDYSCEGHLCGSEKGWGVYFPGQLDGERKTQNYVAGVYPDAGPAELIVAAHVTQVGAQTRVALHQIDVLVDNPRSVRSYADRLQAYWDELETPKVPRYLDLFGFSSGSAHLSKPMKLKLRAIALLSQADEERSFRLLGYTDGVGSVETNVALSIERAMAVKQFLVELGVPGEKLKASGQGVGYKIASAKGAGGNARLRRVAISPEPDFEG